MSQVDFGNGLIIRDTNDSGAPQTAANSGIVDGRIVSGISASDLDAINGGGGGSDGGDKGNATQDYIDSVVNGAWGVNPTPGRNVLSDIANWIKALWQNVKDAIAHLLPDKKTLLIVALAALLLIIVLVKVVQ